jgi:hypothetical protein
MPNRTFPELIGDVDKLSTNLRGRLVEMPHLTPLQADLEAWLIEARSSESQQGVYTARLREVNEQRRGIETRGVALKSRAVDNLRGHFGGQAKTLHEFGVRPRRTGGRRRANPQQPQPEPGPQPPAEQPQPAPAVNTGPAS